MGLWLSGVFLIIFILLLLFALLLVLLILLLFVFLLLSTLSLLFLVLFFLILLILLIIHCTVVLLETHPLAPLTDLSHLDFLLGILLDDLTLINRVIIISLLGWVALHVDDGDGIECLLH